MPPVKPCSSRSRSNIRFAVCCCFFGRPFVVGQNAIDDRNEWPHLRLHRRLRPPIAGRHRECQHLVGRSSDQSQTAAPPPACLTPRSEPPDVPSHRVPRPSSLSPSAESGKELPPAGFLLRRYRTIRLLPVRDFRSGV